MESLLIKTTAVAGLVAAGVWALPCPDTADAADHTDSPSVQAMQSADIGDFYVWHDGTAGTMTAVMTYAPLQAAGGDAVWDAGVLYGIHIDLDGDAASDRDIWVQFGQNGDGDWGMHVTGLPGASGDMVGPAGDAMTDGNASIWAGLADDPFFFDLQGFQDTLATATLSFDNTRDSLAGTNAMAIVVETALSDLGDPASFGAWASTRVLE